MQAGEIKANPLREACAAISVGIVGGVPLLDLPYVEDSAAEVDMNVVMTEAGASSRCRAPPRAWPSAAASSTTMLALAERGITELIELQNLLLADPPEPRHGDR